MRILLDHEHEEEIAEGSTAQELAQHLRLTGPDQGLAAEINGHLCDLNTPLAEGDRVRFISFSEAKGKEIFWHSSAHILAQAILRLWPEALPTIGPPIEAGFYYDFANLHLSEEDFPKIEKEMKAIAKANYRASRIEFTSPEEALEAFVHNPYKVELIKEVGSAAPLSAYRQGEFFDLCRGPHLPSTGKVKALKVLKTSGAYWRGDSERGPQLTRIYAIAFPSKEELQTYLHQLEESKKRDHKRLGPQLGLFSLHEEAPGMPFFHPHGLHIWKQLIAFQNELLKPLGYTEIKTPILMRQELWERSGHWAHYQQNMFTAEREEILYALKPMNCPGCMLYYKTQVHSYRELPLKVQEYGHVHRNEASGALSGLFRVRAFTQDDAHLFLRPEQLQEQILELLELAARLYGAFGLRYHCELSTRPEEGSIGRDEDWEFATAALRSALEDWGHTFRINEGDGAFYGPKIDFHLRDALGRSWQCGTIQLDMALPERFDLHYTAEDGSHRRPVMLHRALYGSMERFFGQLIEHFGGRFPLWLSPRQIRLLTVADRHHHYAQELAQKFDHASFLVEVESSGESVSKKVRQAQLDQVNYILTLGDKEVEEKNLSLRTREGHQLHGVPVEEFIHTLSKEQSERLLTSPYASE